MYISNLHCDDDYSIQDEVKVLEEWHTPETKDKTTAKQIKCVYTYVKWDLTLGKVYEVLEYNKFIDCYLIEDDEGRYNYHVSNFRIID
jgi:hypothetical protein